LRHRFGAHAELLASGNRYEAFNHPRFDQDILAAVAQ
jgi:hypothetical protein